MMAALNFLAYCAQVAFLVLVCAGLPRLLGLRSPGVQYAFWRTLLVVCLALPAIEPWRPVVATVSTSLVHGPPPVTRVLPDIQLGPPLRVSFTYDVAAIGRNVVLAGIAIRLAWMALGMIRLRRMRRRATDATLGFEDLRETIGARAPILWSSEVRHPVTFGVLKPVVLLPVALKAADLPAQRAVVAHELHHVQRRDWGWVVAEEVIRSAFWFHPAMWWLLSRVQLARETVVDELSILVTNARRTYLDTLLAFADDTGLASSPAFSARRHLFHRVMLLSKEGEMSSIRVAVGSCVLVLALGGGTWGAVTAFPLYGGVQDQKPPRDPRYVGHPINVDFEDADLRTVLRVFAKESGLNFVIYPEVQGRVNVLMYDVPWDQALDRILRSNKLRYTVEGSILRIAPLGVLADEQSQQQKDELRDKANALRGMAPGAALTAGASAVMSEEYRLHVEQLNPVRIGGNVKMPMKTRDVKPAYPPIAESARVQGVVIIEALVDAGGQVVDARILRSIPLLDEAALAAVRQWEFVPTLLNGAPVAVLMTVTVNFTLAQ